MKEIKLENIKNPNQVKDCSYKEIKVLSDEIRNYIVDITSRYGGHLSSNLGNVEATISLCRIFDFDKDKIIFDVGHQAYTYKILTGRSLEHLRTKDGPSGFQKRSESPYDHYEAGHSSTSISAANGFAIARDLKGEKYDVIAFVGDASIVNGLSFEALNNISHSNHKVIIVLNDNEMSISKAVGGLNRFFRKVSTSSSYISTKSKLKKVLYKSRFGMKIYNFLFRVKNSIKHFLIPATMFDNMGYTYIGPIDGHDVKAMDKAFKRAKKTVKSVVIHIRTKKGKGYQYSENDKTGQWHGVSKFDIKTGSILKDESMISWSNFYASYLDKIMEEENRILITPGTEVGSCLAKIMEKYPERSFDVGIAEEHALTMASSLSLSGYHPIISIYSTFLQRAYDELQHDLARLGGNATLLIDRSGLVGQDGETHQGLFDESFINETPNTVIAMAVRPGQVKAILDESFNNHGVFAIRLPRGTFGGSVYFEEEDVSYGKWKKTKDGKKIALVGVGPNMFTVENSIQDLDVMCYEAIYTKPMDDDAIKDIMTCDNIIIYDAYGIENGFAYSLNALLTKEGYKGNIYIKSIPIAFVKQASVKEQETSFDVAPENIVAFIKSIL